MIVRNTPGMLACMRLDRTTWVHARTLELRPSTVRLLSTGTVIMIVCIDIDEPAECALIMLPGEESLWCIRLWPSSKHELRPLAQS